MSYHTHIILRYYSNMGRHV